MLAKAVTLHNSKILIERYDRFSTFGKLLLYSVLPFVLLMAQNDLGTTLVYAAILAGIILLSGFQWKILLPIVIIVSSLGIGILLLAVYNPDFLIEVLGVGQYQILRIHTWLDPYQDTTASSYQVTQAFKAIGSGGVFGKGLGVSEVYVPVRESDMIFTTITENFGFMGGSFLIFIYFVLIYNMIKIVYDQKMNFMHISPQVLS